MAADPLSPELEAQILKMSLELEAEALQPESCYAVSADRVARLATIAAGLTPANAVAVTCKAEGGEIVETIVNSDTMEHCLYEDPIMYTELSISTLVEAQFEEGGPWVLARGTLESIQREKSVNFKQRYVHARVRAVRAPSPHTQLLADGCMAGCWLRLTALMPALLSWPQV